MPATLAVLLLAFVVIGSAIAFSIPNRTPPPDGGDALNRYLPLVDGDAALSSRIDADGNAAGWEAANTDVLGDGEALLSLTATTFTQLIDLYGAADKDPVPPGMADATVRVELATTIDASGAIVTNGQHTNVVSRDDLGDRLLTVTDATGELAFNPPALIVPAELDVGKEWSSSGTAGALEYTVEGKVVERTKTDQFDDCLRFEVSSAVGESTSRSQNVACAGIGIVERDDLDENGALFQHIDVLTSGTTQFTDDGLPTPPAAVPSPPAPEGELSLGRVGKGTPTGSISPPTFPAQFVPSDPPSILVASERGDLVALAADTPDVVQWRFHPGGSMYGAPGLDPETGWLYAGATDKRLYALDGRGYFLWSVEADDNIATRPVVARGIVAYASEAGTAFGIDAATGEQRWKRDLGAGSVAWPAVVDDTVVFGTDDGTIRAVDIDDGSGRWSHTADGSVEAAITTDSAGTAYVADSGGGVRAVDATTGDVLWHMQENDSFRSAAVATNGLVVFVGESGAIYAVDAETGDTAWQSTGDFIGPVAETGGAIVVARASGFLDEIAADGSIVGELAAQSASAPGDPAPDYRLGLTGGAGAAWSVDESAVVRRIGPGPGGLTALQARWVHTFTEQPFSGGGFPATVGEFQDQAVLMDAGGAVYLLDPKTGDPERIGDDPESSLAAGTAAVVDGSQVFMTLGGALRAVDLPSGSERWNDEQTGTVLNPPVVVGDVVVVQRAVTLDDGTFVSEVVAHDRVTGEERWTRQLTPAGSGPTAAGDLIIAGSPLTALDARDGSIVWQVEPDRSVNGAPGFDPDEGLVVAALRTGGQTFTQDLVAVDAATGEERWRAPIDGAPEFTEAISVHDGLVVVPEVGLPVVGFDEATGAELWQFTPPPPGRHVGTATIENGQVWMLSSNGRVFVLDATNGEVLAQSSGLPNDVSSFFAPWGMQPRSVDGVFIAPMAVILSAFDPPEAP